MEKGTKISRRIWRGLATASYKAKSTKTITPRGADGHKGHAPLLDYDFNWFGCIPSLFVGSRSCYP